MSSGDFLSYITAAGSVAVASAAVFFTRRSSKDGFNAQRDQKSWEKRNEVYLEIIEMTKKIDPHNRPTPQGYASKARDSPDGAQLLPLDLDGEEWKRFESRVEAMASDEVRYAFSVWMATLAGWSWIVMKCTIHIGGPEYAEAEGELNRCRAAAHLAHVEMVEQIRAELRFEKRTIRYMEFVRPEGFLGAVIDIRLDQRKRVADLTPLTAARVLRITHKD